MEATNSFSLASSLMKSAWLVSVCLCFFFFSSRRRHTRFDCDWSSDVCSSDLPFDGTGAVVLEPMGYRFETLDVFDGDRLVGGLQRSGAQLVGGRAYRVRWRSEERRVGEEGRSRGGPDH